MSTSISHEFIRRTVLQEDVFEPSYELVEYALSHLDEVSKDKFIADCLEGHVVQSAFNAATSLGVIPMELSFRPAVMYDTWNVNDVIELGHDISPEWASHVLSSIFKHYDANEGVNQEVINRAIHQMRASPIDAQSVLFHPDVTFVREALSKTNEAQKNRLIDAMAKGIMINALFEISKEISMIPEDQVLLPFSRSEPWTTNDVRMDMPDLSEAQAAEVLVHAFNDVDSEIGINYDSMRSAREALYPEVDFILPATVTWTDEHDVVRGETVQFNLNNGDILGFSQADNPNIQNLSMVFAGYGKTFNCASTENVVFDDNSELIEMRDELVESLGEAMLQDLRIKTNLHVAVHDSSPSL